MPGANHKHTQMQGKILFSWFNAQFIKIPSAFSLNEEISLLTWIVMSCIKLFAPRILAETGPQLTQEYVS